jgi:tryptophanase
MENLKAVHSLTESNRIPIVLDCARIAENAYFIKQREPGYENKTIRQITQELCSYCETAIMSAKKDALVNIGGLFVTRNRDVFARANQLALAFEGYITYGGLAGRDLEAIAVGLLEGCDEVYLEHRIAQVNYLGNRLKEKGIPIVEPVGGHGVYVNSVEFFPHIPGHQNPSQRLVTALYEEAGVRAVAMTMSTTDYSVRSETPFELDCMRIAIPRRAYTNNHLDVIANALGDIYQDRHKYRGMKQVDSDWNSALSLFTSKFELL